MALELKSRKGFSLIIVAMIIALAGAMVVTLLPIDADKVAANVNYADKDMQTIIRAVKNYKAVNSIYPNPAAISYLNTNSDFGKAYTGTCSSTTNFCESASGKFRIGGVPTRTLGLPDDYAFDKWGNRYLYAVNSDGASLPVKNLAGDLISNVKVFLLSHGPDGIGAYNRIGEQPIGCSKSGTTATTSEIENCNHGTATSADYNFIHDKWDSSAVKYFDDITSVIAASTSYTLDANFERDYSATTQGTNGFSYIQMPAGTPASATNLANPPIIPTRPQWYGTQASFTPFIYYNAGIYESHPGMGAGTPSSGIKYLVSSTATVDITLTDVLASNVASCAASAPYNGVRVSIYKNNVLLGAHAPVTGTTNTVTGTGTITITRTTTVVPGDVIILEFNALANTLCDSTRWVNFTIMGN